MDAGLRYDIHPKRKKPIGQRLALQALHYVYDLRILSDSPTVRDIRKTGNKLILSFRYGDGLHVKGDKPQSIDLAADGKDIEDFSASLRDDCLVISAPELEKASSAEVRFAWHPWCEDNIYNSSDLPVLPFRISWQK